LTQGRLQRPALNRLCLLDEEAEAILAVFLGEVHCRVGVLGQRLRVGAIDGIHRDTDAGRGVAFVAAQLQRLAEDGQQVAGDPFDVVAFRGFVKNDDEFIATKPRDHVTRTQGLAQPVVNSVDRTDGRLDSPETTADLDLISTGRETVTKLLTT
jgi:hypothetical protein